ncbi:MAG: M28 family peptidase [Terriglobia bacterium]
MRPVLLVLAVAVLSGLPVEAHSDRGPFSGQKALEHTKALVGLGPRTPGSPGHQAAQKYIIRQLRLGYNEVEEVEFVASTPAGLRPMKNIIGKIPGRSRDIIVLAGHYDTKTLAGFVGANDGGSSTGLLLELARVLGRRQPLPVPVWVVFFDGEEAFRTFTKTDGLFGSRYQANRWARDGVLPRIRALLLVDMIGDKHLNLRRDANSTRWLTDMIWRLAEEKGHGEHFLDEVTAIEDDHVPFVRAGVPAIDLIDLDFGPGNGYWHTTADTLDKLSAESFHVIGEVVLAAVKQLSGRWPGPERWPTAKKPSSSKPPDK